MSFKITNLRSQLHLAGTNELKKFDADYEIITTASDLNTFVEVKGRWDSELNKTHNSSPSLVTYMVSQIYRVD